MAFFILAFSPSFSSVQPRAQANGEIFKSARMTLSQPLVSERRFETEYVWRGFGLTGSPSHVRIRLPTLKRIRKNPYYLGQVWFVNGQLFLAQPFGTKHYLQKMGRTFCVLQYTDWERDQIAAKTPLKLEQSHLTRTSVNQIVEVSYRVRGDAVPENAILKCRAGIGEFTLSSQRIQKILGTHITFLVK